MTSRGDVHALVAGVNFYVPSPAGRGTYPSLHGCAADAREVALFLTGELGVPADNVRLLTSTTGGPGGPAEPPEQLPDYGNLTAALTRLAAEARRGDQVLHLAGHGSRVPTLVPEVKGEAGLDECLVPYDAGAGGRLLRDVEIAAVAAEMAARGLDVTLALDCCHAGGGLRAPDQAVRGVSFVDTIPRPGGSAVASREALAAAVRSAAGRSAAGAVLLAACRPGELALEVLLEGRRRGVFTWALLDALRRLGTGVAYRRLHERILARVHTRFEIQTPMLDGDTERRVLGGEIRSPLPTVPVLAVEPDSVLLAAGAPEGVGAGAWFAVYPLDAQDLSRIEERVALVEVVEAGATNSRARVATVLRTDRAVEEGAPAVLMSAGSLRVRRSAALLAEPLRTGPSSPLHRRHPAARRGRRPRLRRARRRRGAPRTSSSRPAAGTRSTSWTPPATLSWSWRLRPGRRRSSPPWSTWPASATFRSWTIRTPAPTSTARSPPPSSSCPAPGGPASLSSPSRSPSSRRSCAPATTSV